jgi:small GTP-binding protein
MIKPEPILLKILIFGQQGVGKTSLLQKLCPNAFIGNLSRSVGVDFHLVQKCLEGKTYKLQFWSVSPTETFSSLSSIMLRNTSIALFMASFDKKRSFKVAKRWKEGFEEAMSKHDFDAVPCVLVANKAELVNKNVFLSNLKDIKEIEIFSKKEGFDDFLDISVNLNKNLDELVGKIVKLGKIMMQVYDSTNTAYVSVISGFTYSVKSFEEFELLDKRKVKGGSKKGRKKKCCQQR